MKPYGLKCKSFRYCCAGNVLQSKHSNRVGTIVRYWTIVRGDDSGGDDDER